MRASTARSPERRRLDDVDHDVAVTVDHGLPRRRVARHQATLGSNDGLRTDLVRINCLTKLADRTTPLARVSTGSASQRLSDIHPELASILKRGGILSPPRFEVSEISVETVMVPMRDGVGSRPTSICRPASGSDDRCPHAVRAGVDHDAGALMSLARRGFAILSQDVRGTGGSEPAERDIWVYEPEDGYDCVEWIGAQEWFDGFLGAAGASYVGQTQWHMALHPAMSTIVPEVSGLGIAVNTAHLHMFMNAYARSVGHGLDKVDVPYSELEALILEETLSSGTFDEPLHEPLSDEVLARFPELREPPPMERKRRLWERYCSPTAPHGRSS